NLSIEASTDSELQASMKMVSYYRNKFETLLQEKKMSGVDIFESYAMLESFVRGKAFDYIFKDLILEVKLKKTSTTQSYKAYGRILRSFLEKNLFESLFLPNENVLKSA